MMPRPRADDWLQDEVNGWKEVGLDVVISLLEDTESQYLGLETEAARCQKKGIEFIHFPIRDRSVPTSKQAFSLFVAHIMALLQAGTGVGVHCRTGIGRTGLVVGCILGILGKPAQDIFALLTQARGVAIPDTPEQREWVYSFLKQHRIY